VGDVITHIPITAVVLASRVDLGNSETADFPMPGLDSPFCPPPTRPQLAKTLQKKVRVGFQTLTAFNVTFSYQGGDVVSHNPGTTVVLAFRVDLGNSETADCQLTGLDYGKGFAAARHPSLLPACIEAPRAGRRSTALNCPRPGDNDRASVAKQ
jgi:hypothetical protein